MIKSSFRVGVYLDGKKAHVAVVQELTGGGTKHYLIRELTVRALGRFLDQRLAHYALEMRRREPFAGPVPVYFCGAGGLSTLSGMVVERAEPDLDLLRGLADAGVVIPGGYLAPVPNPAAESFKVVQALPAAFFDTDLRALENEGAKQALALACSGADQQDKGGGQCGE